MVKLDTPERIGRNAFGGADILKVQSQHEKFLREIETLSEDQKAIEITNAIKYLIANKSDYWLETAHLLQILLGDSENDGLYKKIEPNIPKKEFCPKYIGMAYKTVSDYIRVIRDYENYGFSEEQIRVLGFTKTREILSKSKDKFPHGNILELKNKSLEELKKLKHSDIVHKKTKSTLDVLNHYWNKATTKEKKEFLRIINAGENPNMAKNHR